MKDIRRRGWQRALSGGKVAGAVARLAGRQLLGRREDAADGALGEAIARELDQMKGMAMKVGQIVSYFDGILPEATHVALRALQKGATAVPFERMQEVIVAAFNATPDVLFESFNRTPIASASIGQVYRARHAGREVAVKVQYPGIRATMHSDFARLNGISRIASLATSVDGPALVRELQDRVDEECDYRREAASQAEFANAFAADDRVHIPEVFSDRTCETVLTTEWGQGLDFYTFLTEASQESKNNIALVLAGFAFRSLFRFGAINADPHPGNYLFPGNDEVVFLDFGCVRRFDASFLTAQKRLIETVIEGRRERFEDVLMATGMVGKHHGFDFDHHWQLLRHEYSPYCTSAFEFDKSWLKRGMDFSKPGSPNARQIAIPPQWIWLERLIWGLHAVLTRLGARGDFAQLMRSALAESVRTSDAGGAP